MKFQVLTLFPERFTCYLNSGLPARAHQKGLFEVQTVQLRDFADPNRGGRIDDTPYGGGPGMVLEIAPVERALQSLEMKFPVILFTPRGRRLNQRMVREFLVHPGFTLISGYYEGVDERIAEHLVDDSISLGDFVLNSGDLPALCFIEAVTRLLPGYMGSFESQIEESNENELIEYPHYTRPANYNGWQVPEVLLSGNHEKIRQWRMEKSKEITQLRIDRNGI